jgi:glycerol-3-phosphate acyltransferase PlsY
MKGLVPALVARVLFPERQELWLLAGALAIFGHSFSPFLRFKGGKGIATALGMVIGASPLIALSAFLIFASLLWSTRYMSLASILAVASTVPLGLLMRESVWMILGYCVLTTLIVFRHRSNIIRLKTGTEPKFSFKRTVKPPEDSTQPVAGAPDTEEEQPNDAA